MVESIDGDRVRKCDEGLLKLQRAGANALVDLPVV